MCGVTVSQRWQLGRRGPGCHVLGVEGTLWLVKEKALTQGQRMLLGRMNFISLRVAGGAQVVIGQAAALGAVFVVVPAGQLVAC